MSEKLLSHHLDPEYMIPLQDFSVNEGPASADTREHHRSPENSDLLGDRIASLEALDSDDDDDTLEKCAERRKVVLARSRPKALWHFLLFHAVPLGVALFLIVFNIKTYFYGTDGSTVNLLQFAAKAHEVLMQASILTVMIAYIQYLLTNKFAIPFGAIFSVYHIGNIAYLMSPEFFASLTTPWLSVAMKIVFLLFIPFSIALASAVGPSSAIAMLPRFGNYTLPDYTDLALNLTSAELYPDVIDKTLSVGFAAAGWGDIYNLPVIGLTDNIKTGLQRDHQNGPTNIMPPLHSVLRPAMDRTMYVQYAPNGTLATVQHIPVSLALAEAAKKALDNWDHGTKIETSVRMPQPYVSVLCELNAIKGENDTRPIQFPDTYIAPLVGKHAPGSMPRLNPTDVINYTDITRKELWEAAKKDIHGQMIWVDDIKVTRPVSTRPLGVIVVHSEFCEIDEPFLTTSACLIGSTWANTTSSLEFGYERDILLSRQIKSSLSTASLATLPSWSRSPISLSKSWAESLNPTTKVQNQTVADNLLQAMPITPNICPTGGNYSLEYEHETGGAILTSYGRPFMHEALVASMIVSGLSGAAGPAQLGNLTFNSESKKWTWKYEDLGIPWETVSMELSEPPGVQFIFGSQAPGYVWNTTGTSTKLSICVLSIYCLYTVAYVLYTFFSGRSSRAWATTSELTALAMNSTPTSVLDNTSAGIANTDTFKHHISVQEVEANRRLELIFNQDKADRGPLRRVGVGKYY
ncbi:uncharacterized protein CIMG_00078 [Coccidioides immitis RS]|uniref:Uncharacterized protein n=2 Tax=Coccidioides immitis TaxID=5501 RepID=J3KG83_COCIM|nr:uncharacterized protein CIMG_00078 [Coccidioides immitis RS]EAS34724.3 hypothetical protein CIMG_00078 [Coccidioides immitis RS]KMU88300.1 hypothetical protein CIHG_06098 [Coccidioides immitis H538.4]TPX26930.1 hypothetical protein DIZ76_012394 [Coccidioides immitis]